MNRWNLGLCTTQTPWKIKWRTSNYMKRSMISQSTWNPKVQQWSSKFSKISLVIESLQKSSLNRLTCWRIWEITTWTSYARMIMLSFIKRTTHQSFISQDRVRSNSSRHKRWPLLSMPIILRWFYRKMSRAISRTGTLISPGMLGLTPISILCFQPRISIS